MNDQRNGGINWTDWTWNPVTGCNHGCPYCYARAFAERYGRSFKPAFHTEKLVEPTKRQQRSKIFVCSNADLFGNWVPERWVHSVLDIVRQCPQHTFQFLTKAPHNLAKYNPWPANCWVGASATDRAMMDRALAALRDVQAPVRFVSAEPLLGAIGGSLVPLDWLIIGAQTGPGGHQPHPDWVQILLNLARTSGTRIWLKDNLFWSPRVNEWPCKKAQLIVQPAQMPLAL